MATFSFWTGTLVGFAGLGSRLFKDSLLAGGMTGFSLGALGTSFGLVLSSDSLARSGMTGGPSLSFTLLFSSELLVLPLAGFSSPYK